MEKIEFEDELFDAIKKDDLKSFSLLMVSNSDLNICYSDSITEPSSNTLPSQGSNVDNNTWHF